MTLKLKYMKIPWTLWGTGIFFIIFSLFLWYHLLLAHWGGSVLKSFLKRHWWQYLLSAVILIIGFCFFVAGKVKTLLIDKNIGTVLVRKTACFCIFSNTVNFDISEIQDIRAYKKG
jgi:hypothetical protein